MKSSTQQFTKVAFSCLQSTGSASKSTSKQKKTKLNLFGKGITHIKPLSPQQIFSLQYIKQLDLSHNAITSIENLKPLPIQQLNLSHNKIQDQQRIYDVFVKNKNCQLSKNIKKLILKGNPFLKKPLSAQTRRWLFCIQNDMDLYTKEQHEYLDLLVQRYLQKIMLQNLLNKLSLNLQFIQQHSIKLQDDYQRLLLTRPQDYFKIIKRQMEWKIQAQPLSNMKKQVVMNLPVQLFARQRTQLKQYASPLILQLRKRNQLLIRQNKQTVHKIEQGVFSYLTQRKMILENQPKVTTNALHSVSTPYKNLFVLKQTQKVKEEQPYPQANTPIYTKRFSSSKPKPLLAQEAQSFSKYHNINPLTQRSRFTQIKQQRNPFQQIAQQQQQSGKKDHTVMRQISKNKQNISLSPKHEEKLKRIQIKNSSKTLFQLSQSLLQRPVVSSDQSLHFELEQGISQSQIQKMFFQILTKLNPIYHLLYSPLQSLKPSQKSSLITNLLQLLKQKLKYIQKLQKYKLLYETQKQKTQELSILYKKGKQNVQEILQRKQSVNMELKQVEKQVQMLSIELQSKAQQNFALQQENDRLKNHLRQYHEIKLNREEQERIQDIIRTRTEQRMKKTYLGLLNKKAQKLLNFKNNMQQISVAKNRNTLTQCFLQMATQANITKKFKFLKTKILSNYFTNFNLTLKSTISSNKQINQKLQLTKKSLLISHSRQILLKLIQNKSFKQKNIIALKHYQSKIKYKLFRILYRNFQSQKAIGYDLIVDQFRQQSKKRLKKWVFDQWLVWQKGLLHKQVEVRVNHQAILACNVIGRLCQFYAKQRSHQAKSLALQLYLRDMRKLNYFHKLYHFMSTQCQKWKLKLFKINMFTKRIFFDDFVSGVRFIKNKRKIKKVDQQMTCRKLQFNELSEFKLRKKLIAFKVKNKLRECYFLKLKNIMMLTRKQIEVEKLLNYNKIGFFFDQLKAIHKAKSTFRSKKRQLHFLTKAYRSPQTKQYSVQDVFTFFRRKLRFKRLFVQFFINKNKRLIQKTFYQFRINCLEQKANFFQDKLKQLGPDIDLIEERQIQTNIQKVSLARQIQLKNQQLESYEKQVNQLRLLLQAKEIKYEKLKDIYAQSIEINSRQRDFYQMQNSLLPQSLPYDYKSNLSSRKEDNFQKTLKFDSKSDLTRQKLFPTTSYSPERDIMMSRQKRKVSDYVMETNKSKYQANVQKQTKVQSTKKEKLSDFYPSFRRF